MSERTRLVKSESRSAIQSNRQRAVAPACDIYENSEEVLVVADMPGVSAESIDVNVKSGELTFVGRRGLAETSGSLLRAEYRECDFERRFKMPTGIDASKVDAQLRDGVLWLHLPKSEALKPMHIAVHAG